MNKTALVLALMVAMAFAFSGYAHAITVQPSGTQFTVNYTEPTLKASGALLNDLGHCNVYSQVGAATAVKSADIAASSLNGGGAMSSKVTVSYAPPYPVTLTFWATCTNTFGVEGSASVTSVDTIDPPGAPK